MPQSFKLNKNLANKLGFDTIALDGENLSPDNHSLADRVRYGRNVLTLEMRHSIRKGIDPRAIVTGFFFAAAEIALLNGVPGDLLLDQLAHLAVKLAEAVAAVDEKRANDAENITPTITVN
jgi:hypothetical protein